MKTKTYKFKGLMEYIYKPQSELYKRTKYTRHILLTGLLKSTSETSLLGTGIFLIIYSLVQPGNYSPFTIFIGIIAFMGGVLIDFAGDRVKMVQKDREYKITEGMMDEKIESNAVTEERARMIAKKLIRKELDELEDAMCNDPDSLCSKKEE
jgi:hypothetical protein